MISKCTNDINNMSSLFYDSESLMSLPDILNWNNDKVNNKNYLTSRSISLIILSDISKWNTKKVTTKKVVL